MPIALVGLLAAAGVIAYQRPGLLGLGVTSHGVDCTGLTGIAAARLDACLAGFTGVRADGELRQVLVGRAEKGRILALADVELEGVAFTGIDEVAGLKQALMGTDEAAVAERLREARIATLVLDRDLVQALDRDAVVLSRLAQHDHLEWHALQYVSRELFVYNVRETTVRVPLHDGQAMLRGLRARLEGRTSEKQSWQPGLIRIMAGLRLQGSLLVLRHSALPDIEATLDELAEKLARDWSRKLEVEGHGPLGDRLDELRLEVWIVMERATVEPRDRDSLFDLWELGVDGMMLRQREGVEDEKFTYMPGSEAVSRSLNSADAFLRHGAREFGWYDPRPWETDPRTRLELIRTQHFMESRAGGGPGVYLARGMPEVAQSSIDDRAVQQMLIEGAEWWVNNVRDDGSFEYKYWPTQNRSSTEYNEVRHILAARDLADAWRYRNDPRYLEVSRRAMDWLLQFAVHAEDPRHPKLPHPPAGSLLFRYPDSATAERRGSPENQKLGTVAVGLLGWVAWARATGDHSEDQRIREMATFVLSQLEADGRFKPYYVHAEHRYAKERNDIVPGEAALALGEVAEYFGEPEWVAFYPKFVAYYRPWFRERAARIRADGRWPHDSYSNQDRLDLVQFGPWSVMAANQIHRITGDPEAVQFGLEVADWMIDSYLWSAERSPWPDYVGGYYKLPNELPAMQSFCYSEGTAAAWGLANRAAPERAAKYEQATRESVRFLEVMQFDPVDSYFAARPEKIRGGIKYAMNENKIRIDYVGHGLSTLVQYLDVRAEMADPLSVRDPAAWGRAPLRGPPAREVPAR